MKLKVRRMDKETILVEREKGNLFHKVGEDAYIPCCAYRDGPVSYSDLPLFDIRQAIKNGHIYWEKKNG